ncbi:xylulose kinase [Mycolicibacterium arabiense]|uniref:Xylulose kinase n=1 Tax=Mycolicibacterium arabiense TaxID=1286181 RepID=A0A7I7RUE9_9MYCO|nr:FGGY family carbohydrate kinase [Mycolicibacterium arabiense]MCV7375081.1 xylulose kinase [Mycolicibacterium arabiense]BBY48224.1 xylulose kinase [Mycolicibacterium arabiense]
MSPTLYVGIDVGTQTSKAVIFTDGGDQVAAGRADTPWTFVPTGAELDAQQLLDAVKSAVAQALSAAPDGRIAGVGVTSMAEAGVLLDGAGAPTAPVIAWHDTRDHLELESLRQTVDPHEFAATTGLPFRQQWSLTKHRWLVDNVPSARRAVRRLNVAEWIVAGLGGEEATEQSLASRTGWLRLAERSWWADTLDWSGATESLMPQLVTAGTALGRVDPDAGLPRLTGAVLTVAGHDHQAAVVGAGADGPGDELDSCGTAEALVRTVAPGLAPAVVAELAELGITTGWHAVADHWCLLGATQGGLALQRILALLGTDVAGLPALDEKAIALDRTGIAVVAPPFGRLDVTGIADGDGPEHLWRAALEEVTGQAGEIHDAMTAVSGPHRTLVVTGGWSRSEGLLAVKRRRFGDLVRSDVDEAGARGAALFAERAAAS